MTPEPLQQPIQFGDRYTLLELLAVGGMAEIYRARQDAMAGFEKDVVIKRLKPELAADPRIVEMFLDEARISALFNHPNIVHIYDVGEEGASPYIAMELIVGEELTDLCRRGLRHGRFLPLPHAVDLIRQAARGLGYFHAKRGFGGEGLDIVHCDISPTNLLVTEDGGLKVIDFGIARARNQQYRDHSALPGKLSYMSPEQAGQEALDHRSDIYSLAIVLYEITVGQRLFKGPANEVVARLREGEVKPPTFVRQDYPGALESIVMRALERHPEDRYESGYDMADDLHEFLRESGMRSGPLRIARYLDQLNVAGGGTRRPELIAESERRAAENEDDLDFDRGMFDAFQAAVGGTEADAAEWDEVDEDTDDIAAALGVDADQLDPGGGGRVAAPVVGAEGMGGIVPWPSESEGGGAAGAKVATAWPRPHPPRLRRGPPSPGTPDDNGPPGETPGSREGGDLKPDGERPDTPVPTPPANRIPEISRLDTQPKEQRGPLESASRTDLENAVRTMVQPTGFTVLHWVLLAWAVLATAGVIVALLVGL